VALNLHGYQEVAVDHLHRNPRAALFLEMGLGKTAITLRALTPEHLPCLVTAPKRVTENVWATEAALWRPDLNMSIAAGTPAQRHKALTSGADIVVISRDNLADAVPFASWFNTFVLDELSGFKTRGTARWKTARKICGIGFKKNAGGPTMKHVWGLTGTPAPNGLMDLWAQTFLLDGGERLGRNLTGFRERYFIAGARLANGIITEWILRDEADKHIHTLLEDICLSMDGDGRIQLPPVTYNTVAVPLAPAVRKVYKTFKDELVADMTVLGGEVHTAGNAAVLSGKLSQITAGFTYVDDADLHDYAYDTLHKEKVNAIKEIVEGTGSPVLVFYRFRAERDLISGTLPGLVHSIDEPRVVERWNRGELPVLLAHPASAGHGLNLQRGGHTIVWASLSWNLEEFLQGNGRIARQGQPHPVVIHMLVSPDTVDEAIRRRLVEKTSVQAALLEHLESVL
jgi:SNF2 family DNA or RNA helicase